MSHIDVPHLFLIDKQGMIRNDFSYSEQGQGRVRRAGPVSGDRQAPEVAASEKMAER